MIFFYSIYLLQFDFSITENWNIKVVPHIDYVRHNLFGIKCIVHATAAVLMRAAQYVDLLPLF